MSQPIGNMLDAVGVTAPDLEPGDLVSSAVVLAKIVEEDGTVGLRVCRSDGLSYIEVVGMLQVALHSELGGLSTHSAPTD